MVSKPSHHPSAYPELFSPFRIGPYELKNRLVALPVYTGYALPDGRISPQLIAHYTRLAESGVSMVVVANAAVAADGITSTYNIRVDKDDYISGLSRLARVIKKDGALACLQLNHAGRFAKTAQPLLPAASDSNNLAFNVNALKDFMNFFPLEKRFGLTRYFLKQVNTWRQPMSDQRREKIITQFGDAADRAFQAGFDMIELHGANGYLLCQFLSAFTNKLPSEFGGDFQKRIRFPLAVLREVKSILPAGFPIGFRLILREWVPNGIDLKESLAFAHILEKEGIAYLSGAAGTFNSIFSEETRHKMAAPAYLREDMARLTETVSVPTIISGRITRPSLANALILENVAALIGLGRPIRADFNWVQKAAHPEQKITACIDCNWCLKRVVLEQGFNCRRWPKTEQQRVDLDHRLLKRNYKGLWVVADRRDIDLLKTTLPQFLPDSKILPTPLSPTILFLRDNHPDAPSASERLDFLKWGRNLLDRLGFGDCILRHLVREVNGAGDKYVRSVITEGNYGVVIIGRNRSQAWRERLLYSERRKVIALIGASLHQANILVPVDLSDQTLLILMYLKQSYLGKQGARFNFIHVCSGAEAAAKRRWSELKQILTIPGDYPLDLISAGGDVPTALLDVIQSGKYGTVIMGKRGLSGIKRLVLGSVSAGVLRGLTDQTLFLVD